MFDPQGVWKAYYVGQGEAAAEPDLEFCKVNFKESGKLEGFDETGGVYSGYYVVNETIMNIKVHVATGPHPDNITIFDTLPFPIDVELDGGFTSPNFFSAKGFVNG